MPGVNQPAYSVLNDPHYYGPKQLLDEQHPKLSNTQRAVFKNLTGTDLDKSNYLSKYSFYSYQDKNGEWWIWKYNDKAAYKVDQAAVLPSIESLLKNPLSAVWKSLGEWIKDGTDNTADGLRVGTALLTLIPRFSGVGTLPAMGVSGGVEVAIQSFGIAAGARKDFDYVDIGLATAAGGAAKVFRVATQVAAAETLKGGVKALPKIVKPIAKKLETPAGNTIKNYATIGAVSGEVNATRQGINILTEKQNEFRPADVIFAAATGMALYGVADRVVHYNIYKEQLAYLEGQLTHQNLYLDKVRIRLISRMEEAHRNDLNQINYYRHSAKDQISPEDFRALEQNFDLRAALRSVFVKEIKAPNVNRPLNPALLSNEELREFTEYSATFQYSQQLLAQLESFRSRIFGFPRLNKSHGDKSAEELGKQAGGKLSSDLKSRLTPLTGERVYIVRTKEGIEIILRDEISTYEPPIATMTAHGIAKDGEIHPFVSFSPGKPSTHGVKVSDNSTYDLSVLSGSQELFPGQRIILQAGGRPEYTLPPNTDSFEDFLKFDPRLANLGVGESLRIGRAPFPFNDIVIADNPTVSLVHATVKKLPNGNFLVTDGMVGSEQLSLKINSGWAPINNPISLLPGAEVKIGDFTIFKIPEMLRLR